MTNDDPDDYLWDKRQPVDPEVARLERLLGRFGRRAEAGGAELGALRRLGARERGVIAPARTWTNRRNAFLALAAGLLALAGTAAWFGLRARDAGPSSGYVVEGHPTQRFLAVGDWLETGSGEALVEIAGIGTVDLGAGTRLRAEEARAGNHRLFLERGRISAAISADPEVFQVGTPAGLSIDLGCLYDLAVDPDGTTRMAVTSGAVAFDGGGRHVIVPRDARTRATRDRGPASPVWSDASDELLARVEALDFGAAPAPDEIARVVAELSSLTLWHLLQARAEPVRAAAYDALVAEAGAPAGLDRALVLAGDAGERERWLPELAWYRTRFASKTHR